MFIKCKKTVKWKTGTVGVSTQFIAEGVYEVSDAIGKVMVEKGYAEKAKKTKDAIETKVAEPEAKETPEKDDTADAPKDETKEDESGDANDEPKEESDADKDEKKGGLFDRMKGK